MEKWKPIEKNLNKKESEQRLNRASKQTLDLPPELQAYITEEIPQETNLSVEESALADLRMENVRKAAREFKAIDKREAELQADKFKFDKIFTVSSGANRPPQIIAAMRKIEEELQGLENSASEMMQSNPEAYIVRQALELRDYRAQLREGDFVLTPYGQKKLTELETNYYSVDKVPFLNGETGSGKSSIAKYFCKETLSAEPERIPGAKGIDETKIFGKINLSSDDKGPQAVFIKGPLYRAMENGVPLVIEEVNAIPPEILKSLNDLIINAKKGEEVSIIGDPKGGKIKAKEGFGVIMTGNLNRNPKAIDRYKGTYELSADFVNRIRPIDYDYLPQSTEGNYKEEAGSENELFTLMTAMLMTDKGDMNAPAGAFDDLWRLAKFTRKTQEVYSGQRDGKLLSNQGGLGVPITATSSVISMRDVKHVLEAWKRDNFKNEIDFYIYKEVIAPLTNTMDTKFFVQQLQAEGFLADRSWKEVIAKAGTFDSAIHAPENKGKELEFMPVRQVVETVYGKGPERKEFPYDLEALHKSKEAIQKIKLSVKYAANIINNLSAVDYSNNGMTIELKDKILAEAATFITEFDTVVAKAESDMADDTVLKDANWSTRLEADVQKYVDSSKDLLANKIGEKMKSLPPDLNILDHAVYVVKHGQELLSATKDLYMPDFEADKDFIAYHQSKIDKVKNAQIDFGFGSSVNELEMTVAKIKDMQIEFFSALQTKEDTAAFEERVKKYDYMVTEFQKRMQSVFDFQYSLYGSNVQATDIEKNKRKGTYLDISIGDPGVYGLNAKIFHKKDTYPNISTVDVGAQIDAVFNPDVPFKKRSEDEKELFPQKYAQITMSSDAQEVFSNAKRILKEESVARLERFYDKGFFNGNAQDLPSFTINTEDMRKQLSGFIYSEPWMITGFANGEERWMSSIEEQLQEDGSSSLKDFLDTFKDSSAIFCVKTNDGNDHLIKVQRVAPGSWIISATDTSDAFADAVEGDQFIAPRIDNYRAKSA